MHVTPLLAHGIALVALTAPVLAEGVCVEPPNETCDDVIVFTSNELPYAVDGLLGCSNDVSDAPYWDVFYRYDCEIDGEHTFDMCDSDYDTHMRIYVDGCGFSEGEVFAEGDDECPSQPPNADPQVTVTLESGRSYWIELGTWRPDPPWGEANAFYFFNVSAEPGACEGDVTGDGLVDFADILALLAAWGPCGEDCPADFDGSGFVDFGDLLIVLAAWGPCG